MGIGGGELAGGAGQGAKPISIGRTRNDVARSEGVIVVVVFVWERKVVGATISGGTGWLSGNEAVSALGPVDITVLLPDCVKSISWGVEEVT